MKNEQTWQFAHHYFGKLFYRLGWIVLAGTVICMLPTIEKDITFISIVSMSIIGIQLIPLIACIVITERALRKNFDSEGHRLAK